MTNSQIESALGYTFKNKNLLRRALTLSSADAQFNNQTMEFFGDAILEFIVSEKIFDENQSEGTLTEIRKGIVSDSALAPVSMRLGLDKALIKGKGDDKNTKAVPSAYEAVVAAIYLDGGMQAAKKFVLSTLDFSKKGKSANFIGELQEYLQGIGKPCPVYKTQSIGTPQKPMQHAEVPVDGKTFTGEAVRVQDAKQIAAKAALEWIKEKN